MPPASAPGEPGIWGPGTWASDREERLGLWAVALGILGWGGLSAATSSHYLTREGLSQSRVSRPLEPLSGRARTGVLASAVARAALSPR